MKKIIFLLIFCIGSLVQAQNVQLAYNYFRNGEYEKAASEYKKLYDKNTRSRSYFKRLLLCYQELDDFDKSLSLIESQQKKYPGQTYLDVELGYHFHLLDQDEKATLYYDMALKSVENRPTSASLIGRAFSDNHLLDYALKAYEKGMEINPKLNYNLYIALIYGEKGAIEKMFSAYLSMVDANENYFGTIQRYIGRFVTDDSENKNNKIFRKLLLKKSQNNPKNVWNRLLSWLYMQQKDYNKAFVQEKALFRRNAKNLNQMFDLALISYEEAYYETAKNAYEFIQDNTNNQSEFLEATFYILKINIALAQSASEIETVDNQFKELFSKFGKGKNTVKIQIAYADFLTFKRDKPSESIAVLKAALPVADSRYMHGEIKIKLADVLVYTNKFNQALIKYTQVQTDLRGSFVAQTARFKVAQTSYFKGDFDWAKTQLRVLKSATSKLISNDALELNLLIGDNIADDTIRVALKTYAKADLLAYQNKNKQAIDTLSVLLKNFKGHAVEDEALFKQASLYKKIKQFPFAESNYLKIISIKKDGILVDDAYYQLGQLYENELDDIEKAKEMYQKIIFSFASSIHLVESRKRFRRLRGDKIE
jgi:tetratricopeptide (TPR) repeat protein